MNEPVTIVTILIIDDVKVNVELLEGILVGKLKCNIVRAYNGEEALALAKKERPNLILLDILMPDMDGFQVCEKLRQDSSFATTPIIMVTAKDQDKDIIQSLERGADDYVIKPVDSTDLIKKVKNLLGKAKKGEQLPSAYYIERLKERREGKKTLTDYARLLNLPIEDKNKKG